VTQPSIDAALVRCLPAEQLAARRRCPRS